MIKKIVLAVIILIFGSGIAFFVYKTEPKLNKSFDTQTAFFKKFPFRLGLDLSGGSHLIYKADVSAVASNEVGSSMEALRDVIERRVNLFGVSEPVVQVQHGGFISGGGEQLIVDLPGITDVKKAVEMIGQTPILEFKTESPKKSDTQNVVVGKDGKINLDIGSQFITTELTGRYLKRATLEFDQNTREPKVSLQFDETGTKLFAKITKENVGKTVAIFLDGAPVSIPTVNEEIPNGQAVISGNFTPNEAKLLVGRLNSGALPVPITLLSTQTIGATLGESAVNAGVKAAIIGFILVALFLILWYRLPGLIAVLALSLYTAILLAIFKLLPVTLTAAGIGGFIISLGMAVDANVLIFERMKEEIRKGHNIYDGIHAGFARAWPSVRDSNTSSIITSIILFWLGTPLIKGFALTFGLGVLVSMFSAITISRIFLYALGIEKSNAITKFLFGSGFSK
ncbi:MAG: Preprotein translocase subunit SecD [Parcubacteria group bacterium GW2011_GWC1_35_8]|uniref:Protein translocase subunit SecD n=3 Tax=Candidatus Nomuraibacteriota TaxID=1752729 RepID=A0A1F6YWA9_9BACT|nr:MAG: Preprotein translocase subunit SecD [Parcubacteria group bacterium GW2011_GWC1_35_8]KKP88198.1 MAG: Preprotein translocase subunit SecD [Candidatus Nomurabacteria bacterium GW2011_GWC2_35_8]OGJ06340.1 MAG: protein-export membrane protein SecD [Candidatus Nomurabacteria bacterium RIFOXYA2_FULL_35_9]OGJ06659.1 MAG: protein-export membrane protein SecD [Candidatus Nomurabacteria bacterium RIFOXYA1_FULL_35_17]OGJ10623.1 MAG: protein-export membrane protein SecD [Candidatus Nomurabacteria ba